MFCNLCCLVDWPLAAWLLGEKVGMTEVAFKCYLILSNLKLNVPIWLVTTLAIMAPRSSQRNSGAKRESVG